MARPNSWELWVIIPPTKLVLPTRNIVCLEMQPLVLLRLVSGILRKGVVQQSMILQATTIQELGVELVHLDTQLEKLVRRETLMGLMMVLMQAMGALFKLPAV